LQSCVHRVATFIPCHVDRPAEVLACSASTIPRSNFPRFLGISPSAPARHTSNYRRVEMIAITLSIAWLAAESAVSKNSCSKSKMAALRSVANRFLGTALTDSQKCTHLLVQIACQLQTNDGRQPPDRSSLKAHLQNGRGIQRLGDSHERLTDDAVMPPVIERALFTYCAQDNTFQFQTVAYAM